jgi:hypothetical protein
MRVLSASLFLLLAVAALAVADPTPITFTAGSYSNLGAAAVPAGDSALYTFTASLCSTYTIAVTSDDDLDLVLTPTAAVLPDKSLSGYAQYGQFDYSINTTAQPTSTLTLDSADPSFVPGSYTIGLHCEDGYCTGTKTYNIIVTETVAPTALDLSSWTAPQGITDFRTICVPDSAAQLAFSGILVTDIPVDIFVGRGADAGTTSPAFYLPLESTADQYVFDLDRTSVLNFSPGWKTVVLSCPEWDTTGNACLINASFTVNADVIAAATPSLSHEDFVAMATATPQGRPCQARRSSPVTSRRTTPHLPTCSAASPLASTSRSPSSATRLSTC